MGKYIDINKVLEATIEVPQKYWEVEELMREKPNFDKSVGSKKIYERKEFMIFQVREGYIVYNAKKSFQEGHTHLKHFEAAKTAIDLVIRKKIPKSTHGYYLTSLIRLSEDDCYINKIKELMESRAQKGKKDKYYNSRNKL